MKRLCLCIIFVFVLVIPAIAKIDKDLYYPPLYKSKNYIVQKGDCLSTIALKFYGDMNKWKLLHEMNPWIEDPNLIKPGWIIAISKSDINEQEYAEWVREDLKQKVFKICRTEYAPQEIILRKLNSNLSILNPQLIPEISPHFFVNITNQTAELLRKYELHKFVDCIVDTPLPDDWHDIYYLLVAVAWEETRFRNIEGRHGEKGYWQMRPSTAEHLCPDIDKLRLRYLLEYDTQFALILTHDYLMDLYEERGNWRRALAGYNGVGEDARNYSRRVIAKFHRLKRM